MLSTKSIYLLVLWEKNQQPLKQNVYFYTFLSSHVNKLIKP